MLEKPVNLPTATGQFELELIENPSDPSNPHVVLKRLKDTTKPALVRIHSECLTGDVFGSKRCECGPQLQAALAAMEQAPHSYLFYLRQEGRGIGLVAKMQAYLLQEQGMDTVQANLHLGLPADARTYEAVAGYLQNRGIGEISLMTNNPDKAGELEQAGISVNRVPLQVGQSPENAQYRKTKRDFFKHDIE